MEGKLVSERAAGMASLIPVPTTQCIYCPWSTAPRDVSPDRMFQHLEKQTACFRAIGGSPGDLIGTECSVPRMRIA